MDFRFKNVLVRDQITMHPGCIFAIFNVIKCYPIVITENMLMPGVKGAIVSDFNQLHIILADYQ